MLSEQKPETECGISTMWFLFYGEPQCDLFFHWSEESKILANTSCRHIRAWQDYPSLSNCGGRGLGDYGLGYVKV